MTVVEVVVHVLERDLTNPSSSGQSGTRSRCSRAWFVDVQCARRGTRHIVTKVVHRSRRGTWRFVRHSFEHPCGLAGGVLGESKGIGSGSWRIPCSVVLGLGVNCNGARCRDLARCRGDGRGTWRDAGHRGSGKMAGRQSHRGSRDPPDPGRARWRQRRSAKRGRGHGAMDERQRRIRVTRGRIRRDLIRPESGRRRAPAAGLGGGAGARRRDTSGA